MMGWDRGPGRCAPCLIAGVAAAMMLQGCAPGADQTAKAPAAPAPLAIPVSLLDVMRASVEIPASGIWAVQYEEKLSDEQWALVEQDAVDLISGATLTSMPGTGKDDKADVANADWQAWTLDLQKTAIQLREAARAKDPMTLASAGDHLQTICEGCHTKYRPETPSDGVVRYPFYPKRELVKGSSTAGPF